MCANRRRRPGGKGSHGGYCGPAVKPIALSMVSEIARDPDTHGMPISGIGGVTTWRDAAEFLSLGAGNVQVCTAVMTYGFKIIDEMTSGLSRWMDDKGYTSVEDVVGRAVPNVTDWKHLNLNYIAKAKIDQDACISCGRCYAACEDTSHQAIAMSADRTFTVRRRLSGRGLHHHGGNGPRHNRPAHRHRRQGGACGLDDASEQSGRGRGGIGVSPSASA